MSAASQPKCDVSRCVTRASYQELVILVIIDTLTFVTTTKPHMSDAESDYQSSTAQRITILFLVVLCSTGFTATIQVATALLPPRRNG